MLTTFTGVILLTVLALPLAAGIVALLARRRTRAGEDHPWRRSVAEVGVVHGTVPWVWMILLPGGDEATSRVSLVPLVDLVTIVGDEPVLAVRQIVGNLLVFAAFGALAPLRFAALASIPRVVALAAAGSAAVEIIQYTLALDRVSSVDDVLLNAAGAGVAALVSRRWWAPERVSSR